MIRTMVIAVVGFVFLGASGCTRPQADESSDKQQQPWLPRNVQGNWVLRDVDPAENVSAFPMQAMTFNTDQTYLARVVKEGNRLETQRGTYRFDEWDHRLFLHSGGEEKSYSAMIWWGSTLKLEGQTPQGQVATATFVRSNLRVMPEATPADRRLR